MLFSLESPEIFSTEMRVPIDGVSIVSENLIMLRYVEIDGTLRRLLAILKVRDSDFDPILREFTLSDRGLVVGDSFNNVEALLSGFGRGVDAPASGESAGKTQTGS